MNNSVRLICGIFGIALLISSTANASTLRLVLETDDDSGGGSEVFVSSFGNFDDFINSPPGGGTGAFSGIDIAPGFSVAGFAYDGMYRLLLESDDDSGGGSEVFVSSFGNFDDFINSPPGGGTGAFSGIDIAPGFSVAGFAYDGMYRLLLESNDDSGGGSEVFVSSFADFDDFINSPPGGGTGAFSGIDIAPGFSVAGFAYDGMYRLLLESNDDSGALSEVFVSSFANFDDFINSPPGGGTGAFSGIDIAPGFSTRGFAYEFDDPVGQIPLPAALWFFAAGLGPLAYAQKKRRDARKPERRRSAFFL